MLIFVQTPASFCCKANKLTNKTLAAVLGLKTSNLSQYRSMAVRPSFEFLTKFCGKYGFSSEWFLSGDGEPFPGACEKFPEICGPSTKDKIQYEQAKTTASYCFNEEQARYGASADPLFVSDRVINIEEAMGKAYKVLSAGTSLSVALYMNIQQFAAALDTGHVLQQCQDQIKDMQEQIDGLNARIDGFATHSTAERQGDGSEKKAM